jgi:hypothetical protein
VLVLNFWRVIESALILILFVPFFGRGEDRDHDGEVDRVSPFQVKAFLAVFLSLGSFVCLVAGVAGAEIGGLRKVR